MPDEIIDLDPTAVEQVGQTIPIDFSEDYVSTERIRDLELVLPSQEELDARVGAVASKMAIEKEILLDIVSSLAAGASIVIYGPPGTGKTMLSEKLARIFSCQSETVTATADWSTFDTIGGIKVRSEAGMEVLEPGNGCITRAVLTCANVITNHMVDTTTPQAHWLIIDELNRANMDAAFGAMFTALDHERRELPLDFHDEASRRRIYIPKCFRIIGTMNTYDKNFLFRISYGLTRRFSYKLLTIPRGNEGLQREKEEVARQATVSLNQKLKKDYSLDDIQNKYRRAFEVLFKFAYAVRNPERLDREIGLAQILDAFRHAIVRLELGFTFPDQTDPLSDESQISAIDQAIRSSIVPQFEGISKQRRTHFLEYIRSDADLSSLTYTQTAIEELGKAGFQLD